MSDAYLYLGLSGLLTILLWVPYIAARALQWGIPTFLHNYPEGYPEQEPTPPLWAQRSKRAHLNMVETLPAFAAVLLAAINLGGDASFIATAAQIFFYSRIAHAVVYIFAVPALRTPVYLVSWGAILAIGSTII